MNIRCFKRENLYCSWDDNLLGKDVVVADSLNSLYEKLEMDEITVYKVVQSINPTHPFKDIQDGLGWRFAYVLEHNINRPVNDSIKQAYLNGHTIERRYMNGEYEVMNNNSYFDLPGYEYKVASDKPSNGNQIGRVVTYRELSRWLAQGNGEYCYYGDDSRCKSDCFNELRYRDEDGDEMVRDIMVRKWDDTEWYNPTASYLELEN